jgi:hypothetical protein
MRHHLHAVALVLMAACSCHRIPTASPSAVMAPEAGCAAACDHLRALHCPAAVPTPEGATCEDVCVTVQRSGILTWDLECRARAASCDAIDACEATP